MMERMKRARARLTIVHLLQVNRREAEYDGEDEESSGEADYGEDEEASG